MTKPTTRTGPMLVSCIGSVLTWGGYGPAIGAAIRGFVASAPRLVGDGLAKGLMPLPGVGLGYLVTAVFFPSIALGVMKINGTDIGRDTRKGWIACFKAGLLGAFGAVGVSCGLAFGPGAGIVMPLVFCGAPVVNTIKSLWGKELQEWTASDKLRFFTGVFCLILEVVFVLYAKDMIAAHAANSSTGFFFLIPVAVAILSWGLYAPFLHKGTGLMEASSPLVRSLRALRPVGVAYLVVALIVGLFLVTVKGGVEITLLGVTWSFVGGVLGCAGALGISFATYFGKGPVVVMPIVFGGSPFMNTVYTIIILYATVGTLPSLNAVGFMCLGVLFGIIGVVLVLVYKPKIKMA